MKLRVMAVLLLVDTGIALAQFPSQIKNVVVIFQENRTPDNMFHFLTPACPIPKTATGLEACSPSPVTSGCYDISPCGISGKSGKPVPIPLTPLDMGNPIGPDHSYSGFYKMCDPDPNTLKCRNDGAWQLLGGNNSYTYAASLPIVNFDGSAGYQLDPYVTLAEHYGWANYMYQTNQGPSYPAHQIMFSGTSALTAADDANSTFVAENFDSLIPNNDAGCLADQTSTSASVAPALNTPASTCLLFGEKSVQYCPMTNKALIFPTNPVGSFCATHESMADLLDPHSITWKYYAPFPGSIWTAPDAIKAICQPAWVHPNDPASPLECTGTEWNAHVDTSHDGTNILKDIANCNMARVSWVIPDGKWSDHPAAGNIYGPSWVAALVNAIGNNKTCAKGTPDAGQTYWENTAIVIAWDDWGGWSDHEPAPFLSKLPCKSSTCHGDFQYGFRVPMIVVSAYTPKGYINNLPHDFGSVLRMIEGVNHIPEGQLGFADKRASTDLNGFFSLTKPRAYATIPAQFPPSFFTSYTGPSEEPDDY